MPDVAARVSEVETRVVDVIPLPPPLNPERSTPNYRSEEVVATVYAYIAMSEEENIQTIQTMQAQLSRIAQIYLPKAKEVVTDVEIDAAKSNAKRIGKSGKSRGQ